MKDLDEYLDTPVAPEVVKEFQRMVERGARSAFFNVGPPVYVGEFPQRQDQSVEIKEQEVTKPLSYSEIRDLKDEPPYVLLEDNPVGAYNFTLWKGRESLKDAGMLPIEHPVENPPNMHILTKFLARGWLVDVKHLTVIFFPPKNGHAKRGH